MLAGNRKALCTHHLAHMSSNADSTAGAGSSLNAWGSPDPSSDLLEMPTAAAGGQRGNKVAVVSYSCEPSSTSGSARCSPPLFSLLHYKERMTPKRLASKQRSSRLTSSSDSARRRAAKTISSSKLQVT